MGRYINTGDAVECQKSRIAVRKFHSIPPIEYEGVGICFRIKSKIRAIVRIEEELNPKECKICRLSRMELNDEIEADVIEINICTKKRIKFQLESNFSAKHSINWNLFDEFTYAKIITPWRAFLLKECPVSITKLIA